MLTQIPLADIIDILIQASQSGPICGIGFVPTDDKGQPTLLEKLFLNGKPIDVSQFAMTLPKGDRLHSPAVVPNSLQINQKDIVADYNCQVVSLISADNHLFGCLIILSEYSGTTSIEMQLSIELVTEKLKLALERHKNQHSAVSLSNAQFQQKLDLLNEIGSISRTGGWEVELRTGRITWTDEMYSLYGLPVGASMNIDTSMAYFPADTRQDILDSFNKVVKEGCEYCHEGFLHRADGKVLRIKATGKPRYGINNQITHVYGALEDVTEHYRLLETEYNYAAYLAAILDNLNDAVVTIDINGTIITANKTMSTIFGYTPEEVMGQDVSILMPDPYARYHKDFIKHYLETGRAKIIGVGRELPGLHKDGHCFPIELSLSEVIQDGQRQFIGIVKDITERKKALEDIYHTAYFDDLTNLPNLRTFEVDLNKVLNQATSQFKALEVYCCLIDMDNFTQYNLSFGKHVGDRILAEIARRIKNIVEGDLKVYRGMGDNFLILSTAPIAAERHESDNLINTLEWEVHKAITSPITLDALIHSVSAAISSCRLEASMASYEKINGILAFGKKRAKKQGPGSVLTLDKAAFEDYHRYNIISHSFQLALQNNEFYLMLQPQFDSYDQVIGSEALIRWDHPELGFISPVEFISIAEESDAIIDIGNWVIEQACRLLHDCKQQGKTTRIAVNISGRHIVRADFPDVLTCAIQKWGLQPHMLMLEITETALVSSIDLVRERMDKLGELGFSFSIDDFGTGYSSLSYLKELPISELKIDRYFVDEINFSDEEVPIVNSIIDLAHALGVSSVAEGIENEFQREYLRLRGCEFFQGYYYARPLPEKAWKNLILSPAK